MNACTKRFSSSATERPDAVSIAGVIPVMDAMTDRFDQTRASSKSPAVKYGIKRGQAVLDKYYSKTDDSILYRLAVREFD
jgi:hypothetical protein